MSEVDGPDGKATKPKCPECGRIAPNRRSLHHTRRRPRVFAAGLIGMVLIAVIGLWRAAPGPWTRKLPKPVMLLLLDVAARPPAPAAGGLPKPSPTFRDSEDPWERMVWQHQTTRSLSAWADAVLAGSGPMGDAELARLVPMALEAHAAYLSRAGTRHVEGWVMDRLQRKLVRERAAAGGDPDRLLRIEWVLAEMQFEGGGYSHRPDYAVLPEVLIRQALAHADPAVRIFGIERMGRRAHVRVMDPGAPLPPLRDAVAQLAGQDPDAKVRERAAGLVAYMDGFLGP